MKAILFYLIAQSGLLTESSNLKYVCPVDQGRAVFELELKPGVYQYVNIDKSDTTEIAVTKDGAYKLGFYESHPSVIILRDSPFK